jgi:CRISPR/Cas system-associated exonuclease Cas4 (RecB family)
MNRATAWHQSTLDLIGNCSWRYFLTYVCGLPDESGEAARAGTATHAAVEAHERARMEGKTLELSDMLSMVVEGLHPDTAAMAVTACANWYRSKMKDKSESHREWLSSLTPVEIEGYFTMPLVENAMPIGGTIDAIYRDDDGVYHIVDLKTAKDMSRWKKDGEGKRLQATMYSVAVQIKYNLDYLPDVTYAVCRTNTTGETAKRVTVYPDYADVRILGERIREAQRIVDTEDYVRNPGWVLCRKEWCPFYEGCMETGELCGTPATIRQNLLSRDAGDRQDNITASTTDHKEVTQ